MKVGSIPAFPDFIPIGIGLKDEIHKITSNFPIYSDYNFTSLLSWNVSGDMAASLLNDNLVLRFRDYVTGGRCLSFIGRENIRATANHLLDFSTKQGYEPFLKYVPQVVAAQLEAYDEFQVVEDRDNHDYLIDLSQLLIAEGRSYKHFRRSLRNFLSQYADQSKVTVLNLKDSSAQSTIMKLMIESSIYQNEHNEAEVQAVERLLSSQHHLNLLGMGIEIADEAAGFIIIELLPDAQCIGHFWRCKNTYKGIYKFFMHEVAKHLVALDCTRMNIEQDLGISGLRMAKEHLVPQDYLRKFVVQTVH